MASEAINVGAEPAEGAKFRKKKMSFTGGSGFLAMMYERQKIARIRLREIENVYEKNHSGQKIPPDKLKEVKKNLGI